MAAPKRVPSGGGLICRCFRVSEGTVRRAIREQQLRTVEEVTASTCAAGGCSSCYDDVAAILSEVRGLAPALPSSPSPLTAAERRALVLRTFEESVRKLYELNGLKLEILDVHEDRMFTRFRGPTAGTQCASYLSLKWYLVTVMSHACGRKMQQIEMNVLEDQGASALP